MKQFTKEQANKFYNEKCYEGMTHKEIAQFQINQNLLCIPFTVFHEAIEKTIGRSMSIKEFSINFDNIKANIMNGNKPTSLTYIINNFFNN